MANERGILKDCVDIYQGGLAMALTKACVRGNIGVKSVGNLDFATLFGEAPTQILVALESQNVSALEALLENSNLSLTKVATLGGDSIQLGGIAMPLSKAKEIFYQRFNAIMESV